MLTLWAESPEEAAIFLTRAARHQFENRISKIFVAKRSSKSRSNSYVQGEYFETSNDRAVVVYDEVIVAPKAIIELVQWCTCDIMISCGDVPLAVVEDTTHIVRMNVFQRMPRLFKASILGVPAVSLQGTRGLDFRLRGDCWGMHRHLSAIAAINRVYRRSPVLEFFYQPAIPGSEFEAEAGMFHYLAALADGDAVSASCIAATVVERIAYAEAHGFMGCIAPHIPSIEVSAKQVIVHIGAQPERKSWKEKGSGQMDPYIGMIAAAKYMYCFDKTGAKTREMIVSFTHLPPTFWWFDGWEDSSSLYKTLAFEIADKVVFCG